MSRTARLPSATGFYHVILRGINRQRIFEDEEDYEDFASAASSLFGRFDPSGQQADGDELWNGKKKLLTRRTVSCVKRSKEIPEIGLISPASGIIGSD